MSPVPRVQMCVTLKEFRRDIMNSRVQAPGLVESPSMVNKKQVVSVVLWPVV